MGRNRSVLRKPAAVAKNLTSSTGGVPVPASNTFVHVTSLPPRRRDNGVPPILAQPGGLLHAPTGPLVQPHVDNQSITTPVAQSDEDNSDGEYELFEEPTTMTSDEYAKQQDKKKRQWRKWSETVIPAMLKPYLSLLRETDSFQSLDNIRNRQVCTGCSEGRLLQVSCVYFNSEFTDNSLIFI